MNVDPETNTVPPRLEPAEEMDVGRLRYQELFDFAPDGYLVTDWHGVIQEANQAAAELLQTRKEFLLGKPFPLCVAEAQRPGVYALLGQLRHSPGIARTWEVQLRPWWRAYPLNVALSAKVLVEKGQCLRLRWQLSDLTQRVYADRMLQVERAFAESLVAAAQAVVLVLNRRGLVLRCNPYVRTISGWEDWQLLGHPWTMLLPPADHQAASEAVYQTIHFQTSQTFTGGLLTQAGPSRAIAWSVKALPLATGDGSGPAEIEAAALVLGHDITDLQQAQQKAVQAERLAAIGQMTAALAHESRNLLQSSLACLERLSWRLQNQPEDLDLVDRIRRAQRGLTRLFNDIHTYAAPLQLDSAACHLGELWREVWAEVVAAQPDRETQLQEDMAGMDLWCSADRFRLGQVFRNILENALAACAGPVCIDIRCRDANLGGRPALRIAIHDNGPGLNAEQRLRIFEPFYTTKPHGSGLGMSIASRILEAHGGQITVGKNGEGGAEVILLIPRSRT